MEGVVSLARILEAACYPAVCYVHVDCEVILLRDRENSCITNDFCGMRGLLKMH